MCALSPSKFEDFYGLILFEPRRFQSTCIEKKPAFTPRNSETHPARCSARAAPTLVEHRREYLPLIPVSETVFQPEVSRFSVFSTSPSYVFCCPASIVNMASRCRRPIGMLVATSQHGGLAIFARIVCVPFLGRLWPIWFRVCAPLHESWG